MAGIGELIIRILTRTDASGAQAAAKAVAEVGKQAKASDTLAKEFGANFNSAALGLGVNLGRLASTVGLVTAAIGGAKRALTEFAQAEISEADLDSALAQMGRMTEAYRLQLHELAGEYQSLTAIGDEAWLKAFSQLTRFGMSAENVDRVAAATRNLAGLLDGDLNSATMMIARAMQGHTEMFARYGITVQKTGDQVRDFDLLCQQLAQRGAGMLEARAQTLQGGFQNLKNAIGDTFEAMGRVAGNTGLVQNALGFWTEALQNLAGSIDPVHKRIGDLSGSFPTLAQAAAGAKGVLDELGKASLDGLDQQAKSIADSMTTAAAKAGELLQAADRIAGREQSVAEKRIDQQVAEGALTPEEGEREKIAARRKAAQERMERTVETNTQQRAEAGRQVLDAEKRQAQAATRHDALNRQYIRTMDDMMQSNLVTADDRAAIESNDPARLQAAMTGIRQRAVSSAQVPQGVYTEAQLKAAQEQAYYGSELAKNVEALEQLRSQLVDSEKSLRDTNAAVKDAKAGYSKVKEQADKQYEEARYAMEETAAQSDLDEARLRAKEDADAAAQRRKAREDAEKRWQDEEKAAAARRTELDQGEANTRREQLQAEREALRRQLSGLEQEKRAPSAEDTAWMDAEVAAQAAESDTRVGARFRATRLRATARQARATAEGAFNRREAAIGAVRSRLGEVEGELSGGETASSGSPSVDVSPASSSGSRLTAAAAQFQGVVDATAAALQTTVSTVTSTVAAMNSRIANLESQTRSMRA